MERNKHSGKNIKKIESVSGRLIRDLVLEATAFPSLNNYTQHFCKVYGFRPEFASPMARTLKHYAKESFGDEWCKKNFEVGGKYLQIASKDLGVAEADVLKHLKEHKINISVFARRLFPTEFERSYAWFYAGIQRVGD